MKLSKKDINKYLLPVEVTRIHAKWVPVSIYQYKLFADETETNHSLIKFIDINGFIMGQHTPTKLNSFYDKATHQLKNTTSKAVTEIKNVFSEVTNVAANAAAEVKEDANKTAHLASRIFVKLKNSAKDKIDKLSK